MNTIIKKAVDDIWGNYDTDGNGYLDKEECRGLIKSMMSEMEGADFKEADYTEAEFEACFQEFDRDGNGRIDKDEIAKFILKVSGLPEEPPLNAEEDQEVRVAEAAVEESKACASLNKEDSK